MPRRLVANCVFCACGLLLLASGAVARQSDRQKAMDVEADRSEMSTAADGKTHLSGNVHMTQGTLDIKADDAVITQAKGAISRALLKGSPIHMTQQDEDGASMTAVSRNLDYDLIKKTALFTGDVVITQPRGVMRGERVLYDIGTGQVTGGGDGQRVKMHIEPKPADATPKLKQDKSAPASPPAPATAPAADPATKTGGSGTP